MVNHWFILDNAASSQKPISVKKETWKNTMKKSMLMYTEEFTLCLNWQQKKWKIPEKKVNILSMQKHDYEVIFTRGTTESINLIAYALGNSNFLKR